MNYHNILHDDMLNGDGLRVVLFVSGCTHNCPECQNPQTHSFDSGIPFDQEALTELKTELQKDYISGITFSGGDPLHPANRETVAAIIWALSDILKSQNKTVWIYTGYRWDEVKNELAVRLADVLVDDRYDPALNDVNYPWAGSTNQRVIDVQKSLAAGQVILHTEKD